MDFTRYLSNSVQFFHSNHLKRINQRVWAHEKASLVILQILFSVNWKLQKYLLKEWGTLGLHEKLQRFYPSILLNYHTQTSARILPDAFFACIIRLYNHTWHPKHERLHSIDDSQHNIYLLAAQRFPESAIFLVRQVMVWKFLWP